MKKEIYFIVAFWSICFIANAQTRPIIVTGYPNILFNNSSTVPSKPLILSFNFLFDSATFNGRTVSFYSDSNKSIANLVGTGKFGADYRVSNGETNFAINLRVRKDDSIYINPQFPHDSSNLIKTGKLYIAVDASKLYGPFSIEKYKTSYKPDIVYYDALKLIEINDKNDDSLVHLKYMILSLYGIKNNKTLASNPFLSTYYNENLFDKNVGPAQALTAPNISSIVSSVGGLDVTSIANGIADFMIKRAKQELTIAFFDRFKQFAIDNPEFQILFPKTTTNLGNLLSYTYPQMLPALRSGFLEDLKGITYTLDDVLELPRYEKLLKNFPEARIAIKSLRLIHELETRASNAADVIKEFTSFTEWSDPSSPNPIKNVGSCIKIAALFSESIRNDSTQSHNNDIWVSSIDLKKLFYDSTFFNIYLGLIYQQSIKENITFIDANNAPTDFSDILTLQKSNIFIFQNELKKFFDLTAKVNAIFSDIQNKKSSKQAITNDDYYNYINTSIDVVDYAFSFAKLFHSIPVTDNYISIARKSNLLYKDIYTQQYTQAVSDGIDILKQVHDLIDSPKKDDNTPSAALDTLLAFITKIKPYALFITNMVEAKSSDDVETALENAVLPVGSSSIKKNTDFNVSIQSYLGGYLSTSNGSTSNLGSWSDKFGVTAPIGISLTPGFLSWQKAGSLSLFVPLFDIGAIVDYKLKMDSTISSNGSTNTSVVSKDYSIKLGQIFSPGVYAVYGFCGNWPLAVGFGGQYGPGLSKIDAGNNTVLTNPSWRWNLFLAVDLPFFTIKNKMKSN